LKGLSTGYFSEALAALLGKDARGLSAATISRLKEIWKGEYEHWTKRDLSGKHILTGRIFQERKNKVGYYVIQRTACATLLN
jgi:hypothetical protein